MTSDATIEAHKKRIREQYDDFVAFKKAVKDEVREDFEREVERRISGRLADLSQTVHDAFDVGVPKRVLREATRSYTNQGAWRTIWDAVSEDASGLNVSGGRPASTVKPVREIFSVTTEDPNDQGAKFINVGKKAMLVVSAGPDGIEWAEPVELPIVRSRSLGGWKPDPESAWFDEDGRWLPEYKRLDDTWTEEQIREQLKRKDL